VDVWSVKGRVREGEGGKGAGGGGEGGGIVDR